MSQKHTVRILVLVLAIVFSATAFTQDAKKEVKKETKPSIVNDAKKTNTQEAKSPIATASGKGTKKSTKPVTMKYVSCAQTGCGFWAKSHSAKELRYIMKRHSRKYHKIELADKQLKEMVKKEGAK